MKVLNFVNILRCMVHVEVFSDSVWLQGACFVLNEGPWLLCALILTKSLQVIPSW